MKNWFIKLETVNSVATITLNRPEVYNALNIPMAQELLEVMQWCGEDQNVRVVVLTGSGRGFCAGGDMKAAWEHIQSGRDPAHFFRDLTIPLHRVITDMRLMNKPLIAAINGAAGGAGISFAAACDLRIAARSAKFKQAYTSIGLVPDCGWTVFVPQLIGPAKTAELLLLDPFFDADRAHDIGLVNEVVPDERLMDRVQEIAMQITCGNRTAFARAKSLIHWSVFNHLEQQLELERQQIILQGGTTDFLEGLTAFIQGRG